MNIKFSYLVIVLLLPFFSLYGQVDNEFWLAPPSATFYDVGDEDDIEIVITAMQATTVTIEKPSTGYSYTTPTIGAFASLSLKMGSDLGLSMTDIETPPQSLPLSGINPAYNNGFKITSDPGLITVSYKLTNDKSQDQISLKGLNALGDTFMVSTQNVWENENNNYYSGFTIVATEDNTTINIERNNVWTAFPGPFPMTETLTLNTGQTFTVQSLDNTVPNHINGVEVTADKNIAITYWDDQVAKNLTNQNNYKYDFAGDQLVPIPITGTEYIVMKGGMGYVDPPGDGGERVFISGTQDGTVVTISNWDGTLITSFVVNAGEVVSQEVIQQSTYIRSSAEIYVNHYTSVTGGQSVAVAVLPKVGPCTGSHDVVITRSPHASDEFMLNILAVNDTVPTSTYFNKAAEGFYITTSRGTTQIPPNYFDYNDDSTYIVLDRINFQVDFLGNNPIIDVGETALIQNRNAKFHLGVIEGHKNSGTKYGYFSDYGGQSAHSGIGGPDEDGLHVQCSMNPVRLVATGGRSYQWWVDGADSANSANFLSDLTISEPIYYPDTFGVKVFKVRATQMCGGLYENTLVVYTLPQPNAYFEVEAEEVCSPDSILITHGISLPNVSMDWYFNDAVVPGLSENSDAAAPYYHVLPDNNGDTLYTYQIMLQTNYLGACTDEFVRTITVKPAIHSSFEFIGDSVACNPLSVQIKNNSSGNVDSTSYFWDFGDNTISYEEDSVEHTFFNYSLSDTNYTIQLITRSPYDCLDTSTAQVTVYPRVKTLFSTTPNQACSPLIVDVNPVNTIGADTLLWTISYPPGLDSVYKTTNKNAFNIIHNDTSIYAGPDTLYVDLVGQNQFGCTDTAATHMLIAYPAATADFSINTDEICDGDTIKFTNNSIAYDADFYWDLGDGTAPNDSIPADKQYFNPSGTSAVYPVSLTVITGNNCIAQMDTTITVHPYIDANFGVNYVRNCSPLNVTITNNSYRAHIYTWDLGDGSPTANYDTDFNYLYTNPLADADTTYDIKLIVENNEGCSDSITKSVTIKPQVVALMDVTNIAGCSPLTVDFANNSTGGDYFVWNLGGNNLRTDTIPLPFTQSYVNGTASDIAYPISLTASNDAGCDSTVYDTVNVFASITASFTFNKDSSCSPFEPVLTNRSSIGAQVFDWYENGALFSNDENPVIGQKTNTGDSPDIYTYELVTYGVNDPAHQQCADTHRLSLRIFPELSTSFTLADLAMCQPLNTQINNTSNLQDSTQFLWYLDNYLYSDLDQPGNLVINNYESLDVQHTLRLEGETNHGCVNDTAIDVTVYAYIDANFTINKPGICSGDSFTVSRYNTRGLIDLYSWNYNGEFADNRTEEQFNFSFENFTSAAQYKYISLEVSNANCDSTWVDSIQVYPLVTADFNNNLSMGCHPLTSGLTNLSSNADFYRWSFGDGTSSTDTNPSHTFSNFDPIADKTFDISLIAESQYRCSDTIEGQVTVYAFPTANFFLPVSVSCPPFLLDVINSSEGSNLTWEWDLGGVQTSPDFEPTYTFDNFNSTPSYIPISLNVISDKGCEDSLTREITVYPRINVATTASPPNGCSPLFVEFSGDTTNVQQMVWYLDGNLFSTQISPSNIFLNETESDLVHDIKFIAYSKYNCVDSSLSTVTVHPTPKVDFTEDPIPANYDTINDQTLLTFTNVSKHQTSWNYTWDYGDGNNSSSSEFIHDYTYGPFFWGSETNNYRVPVTLIAQNKTNPECADTLIRNVIILPPVPLAEIGEDVAGCVPLTVDFSSFSKYTNDLHFWEFGDGNEDESQNPVHTYNEPGTYTVRYSVEGDGGTNSDYKVITVQDKPEVYFSFNDTLVFVGDQREDADLINFYNHAKNATQYIWYFDGNDLGADTNFLDPHDFSTEKDPVHFYKEIGTYNVGLWAMSSEGCEASFIHPIPIVVMGEGIIEFPTGFFVDPNTAPPSEYDTDQVTPQMYLFYPKNNGVHEYKLEIYNRWGTLIFESDDINKGWNGYIDGVPGKQDVYVWRARGRFTNGQPFDISGDVTLIRAPVNPTINQ